MTKPTTTVLIILAVLFLASPSRLEAQTPSGPESYFNVTFGAQPQRRTVAATATATIFDETALFRADHRIANGAFFDIAVGRRMLLPGGLTLGFAFSSFSSDGAAGGTASIPDPLFRGRPAVRALEAGGLKRSEQSYHLQAVWFKPVSRKIDLAVALGPSLIRVSQQFASGTLDAATQTVTFGPDKESGVRTGLNAGVDFTYLLKPRYGVGLLVRYTWAKIPLAAADVTAGGFQGGLGLRLQF